MPRPRFHLRTLMIAVPVAGVILALSIRAAALLRLGQGGARVGRPALHRVGTGGVRLPAPEGGRVALHAGDLGVDLPGLRTATFPLF